MSDILTSISSLSEAITTSVPNKNIFYPINYTKINLARDVRLLERQLLMHPEFHDRVTLESISSLFEICLRLVNLSYLNPTLYDYNVALWSLQDWTSSIQNNLHPNKVESSRKPEACPPEIHVPLNCI